MEKNTIVLQEISSSSFEGVLSPTPYLPINNNGQWIISGRYDKVTQDRLKHYATPAFLSAKGTFSQRLSAIGAIAVITEDELFRNTLSSLGAALARCLNTNAAASAAPRDVEYELAWWAVVNICVTESGLKLGEKNPASSAMGLGQIIKSTWASAARALGGLPSEVPTAISRESVTQQLTVIAYLLREAIHPDKSCPGWMLSWQSMMTMFEEAGVGSSTVARYFSSCHELAPLSAAPPALRALLVARFHYGNGSSDIPYWLDKARSQPGTKDADKHALWAMQQVWRLYRWTRAAAAIGTATVAKDLPSWDTLQLFSRDGKLFMAYPQ